MEQHVNKDAETARASTQHTPATRSQPLPADIESKSEVALDVPPKSQVPAVSMQQQNESAQTNIKGRLAEKALQKLETGQYSAWKGIDYILNYTKKMEPESSKTDGKLTVKKLLDGVNKLQEVLDKTKDGAERNLWDKWKIGERMHKAAGILSLFLSAGDVAVSFDPVHAALPWAGIRVVLVVSVPDFVFDLNWLTRQLLTSHRKVNDLVIACFNEVALLVFQCESYEQLYIHDTHPSTDPAIISHLEDAVVAAYCESLLFLASTVRHDEQHRARHIATAPFKLEKMEDHLSSLNKCVANLSHCGAVCHAEHSNRALTQLQRSLLDAARELERLEKSLGSISGLL